MVKNFFFFFLQFSEQNWQSSEKYLHYEKDIDDSLGHAWVTLDLVRGLEIQLFCTIDFGPALT